MLIFHYISYKFDKISHLKNQIWHWKISILPDSQNQHFSEKSADLAPLAKCLFKAQDLCNIVIHSFELIDSVESLFKL